MISYWAKGRAAHNSCLQFRVLNPSLFQTKIDPRLGLESRHVALHNTYRLSLVSSSFFVLFRANL